MIGMIGAVRSNCKLEYNGGMQSRRSPMVMDRVGEAYHRVLNSAYYLDPLRIQSMTQTSLLSSGIEIEHLPAII